MEAAAQAEHEEDAVAAGGDGDALFGTETMAELCARQGRLPDAVAIYRNLLRGPSAGSGDDERRARWQRRLEELGRPQPAGEPPKITRGGLPPADARRAPATPTAPAASENGASRLAPAPRAGAVHRLPLVIREPVRSGQIVYAEKNDLIVLGPVNPGAQLIADGNIHVYSRLRGRAVAGAHGATDARIYCQRLEAELIGIDSAYLTTDDIPQERWGKTAEVLLQFGRCVVRPL